MIDSLYRLLGRLGLSYPIHPPVAMVPVGLVTGALVFFAIALILKRRRFVPTARQVSILALAFVLPAILFGVFDWMHFYHGAMMPAIRVKLGLAAALLVLLGLGLILGSEPKPRSAAMAVIYACSFLAVAGLGHFGSGLVYGRGGEVEEQRIGRAEGPPEGGGPALPEGKDLDGKALFASNCEGCHAGGGNAIVASLPIKGSKKLADFAAFQRFIAAPTMPDGKTGDMPPFGEDALEEGQAKALFSFVKAEFK